MILRDFKLIADRLLASSIAGHCIVLLCPLGLDCKVLKNVLKKEKCYNTVMTTANLQAVQGKYFIVKVKCGIDHLPPTVSKVYNYCFVDDNILEFILRVC